MDKKFEILTEKFKAAESVRKEKQVWKNSEMSEKIKGKIKELEAAEKVSELEIEAKIAWKFRESRKMINQQKKILENKIQVEMLKLKIKKDLMGQQKKILRELKPIKPKINPLPYLKNKNKSFIDSEVYSEEEVVEGTVNKNGKNYQVGYWLGNTPGPSKKFWMQPGHRHISPEVLRIKF